MEYHSFLGNSINDKKTLDYFYLYIHGVGTLGQQRLP